VASAWKDYATTELAKMESAAKRKAASAAMGEGDGRPAKRQKVPVRATPRGGEASSVVDQRCASGVGRDAGRGLGDGGWLLEGARRLGSTSSPFTSRRPLHVARNNTPAADDARRNCTLRRNNGQMR
jgi:hypothetical protein